MKDVFDRRRPKFTQMPTDRELAETLSNLANDHRKLYVVIDAVDEAKNEKELVSLLSILELVRQDKPVFVLFTSRNGVKIESWLRSFADWTIPLEEAIRDDIRIYVQSSVDCLLKNKQLKLRNPDLASKIKERIAEKADGLFLQARFYVDHISTLRSDRDIKNALEALPNGLDQSYEQTLLRMKTDHPQSLTDIKRMLEWLSHSYEPVTTSMLAEAVAIEDFYVCLDSEAVATDPEDLVALLSNLVILDHRQHPPSVSFAHLTAYEYLHSSTSLKSPAADFYIDRKTAHRYLARLSVQYLSLSNFNSPSSVSVRSKDLDETTSIFPPKVFLPVSNLVGHRMWSRTQQEPIQLIEKRLKGFHLLKYAALYWPKHVKEGYHSSDKDLFDQTISPYLKWFLTRDNSRPGQFLSWQEIHTCYCSGRDDCEWPQSPLYFAIILGLDCLFDSIHTDHHLPARFPGGWSPLSAAVIGGSA